jgi:hypothetical protein
LKTFQRFIIQWKKKIDSEGQRQVLFFDAQLHRVHHRLGSRKIDDVHDSNKAKEEVVFVAGFANFAQT